MRKKGFTGSLTSAKVVRTIEHSMWRSVTAAGRLCCFWKSIVRYKNSMTSCMMDWKWGSLQDLKDYTVLLLFHGRTARSILLFSDFTTCDWVTSWNLYAKENRGLFFSRNGGKGLLWNKYRYQLCISLCFLREKQQSTTTNCRQIPSRGSLWTLVRPPLDTCTLLV